MSLFQSDNPKEAHHKGILGAFSVDNIKWEPGGNDGAETLAHRFQYEDFPNGSILSIGPSQMAVFTNHMTKGDSVDGEGGEAQVSVFVGPATIRLETGDSRFAPFRNIAHKLTGGESAFHSTVYFINTTVRNDLPWGTQNPIQIEDPLEEVNVHLRANGYFGVHIEKDDLSLAAVQARKFLQKVVGTMEDFTQQDLLKYMRAKILEYVPTLLGKAMDEKQIGVLKMASHLEEFSIALEEKLKDHFDDFGITLDHFSFVNTNVPDEDLRAINEMKQARKRKMYEAEMMGIESQALAEKRAREGYTYQQEQSFNVMGAAATNEGNGSGFMGAGMGLGMGFGVGGAFGSAMGQMAQNTVGAFDAAVTNQAAPVKQVPCPECNTMNPENAKFCLSCGHKFEPASASVCPDCGKPVVPGAKFCLECGRKLTVITNCPSCGKELVPGAKFCLECGTKIE